MRPQRHVAMTRKTAPPTVERHEAAFEELERTGDKEGGVDRGERPPHQAARAALHRQQLRATANIASEVTSITPATARP